MIWVPYFETIISNTCVVRYAYICADVAIIEDYCYARCLPVSPAAPYYRCLQPSMSVRRTSVPSQSSVCVRPLPTPGKQPVSWLRYDWQLKDTDDLLLKIKGST